jgi:hypothetical protein
LLSVASVSRQPDRWSEPKPIKPGEAKVWDLKTGKEMKALPISDHLLSRAVFLPDGKVILWDVPQSR